MVDVFISYDHSSAALVREIAGGLRDLGFDVWHDEDLPAHRDYSEVIEERLREAKAVIAVWSSRAVKSQWVRAEADMAREAGTLVQVSLDEARPPLPFNRIQCADLAGWRGDRQAPGWRKLIASVGALVGAPAAQPPPSASEPLPLPSRPSIAVLPLANLSNDPEQEYFADAVTEDLITALSRWRSFFVIARNSSFAYKGVAVDMRRVGAELGVRYVLEGSVRKVAERVRVTVQLIECSNATHVWADRFDRELTDLLELQDEITELVVRAIEPAVLQSENARIAHKDLKDYSALDCCHRGQWHLNQVSGDHYAPAVDLFRQAIARDPELSLGYIGLARILYGGATVYGWSSHPDQDLEEARAAAETAIHLDPSDADAYFAFAGACLYLGQHREALEAAQRSVALNPNSAYGQMRLAHVLIYSGRPADAVELIQRSLRQSPFDPQMGAMLATLGLAHYQSRNYAEAAAQAHAALEHDFAAARGLLAAALAQLGRLGEAREAFPPELAANLGNRSPRLAPYANDADRDHLVAGLQLAMGATSPAPQPARPAARRRERAVQERGSSPAR
jgi:TolB-like protein/Flp pilus assembly protein TadD